MEKKIWGKKHFQKWRERNKYGHEDKKTKKKHPPKQNKMDIIIMITEKYGLKIWQRWKKWL